MVETKKIMVIIYTALLVTVRREENGEDCERGSNSSQTSSTVTDVALVRCFTTTFLCI